MSSLLSRCDFVHVVQRMAPGGIETLVLDLVRSNTATGAIFSLEGSVVELRNAWPALDLVEGRLEAFGAAAGVKPTLIIDIARRLRAAAPSAVFVHHIGPLIYGSLAARLAGVPRIVHVEHDVWHYENERHRKIAAVIERAIKPDHIAVSEQGRSFINSFLDRARVRVIYNGIDLQKFHAGDQGAARLRFGFDPAWRIVGTVGRLVTVKGHEVLIEAASQLPGDVHIAIAGSGPELANLRAKAERLGVAGRVHFTGHIDAVETVLPAFDVFCLPSHHEGFPRSAIEAQAAGLAVVATDVGALREALCPSTSRLVPPGEPASLATALIEAFNLHDPSTTRTFVERRFAWEHTLSAYNDSIGIQNAA